MELTNSERVLRAITTLIGARDIIGVRDSKMALDNTIFSCPLAAGGSDELAGMLVVGALWGFEMSSFWVGGLT